MRRRRGEDRRGMRRRRFLATSSNLGGTRKQTKHGESLRLRTEGWKEEEQEEEEEEDECPR